MNAIAVIYVNEHLESLRAEARQRSDGLAGPEAQPPRPDRGDRYRAPPDPRLRGLRTRRPDASKLSLRGLTSSLSPRLLPPIRDDLRSLRRRSSCVRTHADQAEVRLGVDVAERVAVRVERPPGRLREDRRRQRLEQRPRRRSPPASSAVAVARPGSRRRAIGSGRPRPSCSRTSARRVGREEQRDHRAEDGDRRAPACRHRRRRPSASARRRVPASSPASGPSNATASWTSITSVGQGRARAGRGDDDDLGRDRPDRVDGVLEQRATVDRLGELVAAEPARPAAGQDDRR